MFSVLQCKSMLSMFSIYMTLYMYMYLLYIIICIFFGEPEIMLHIIPFIL